MRGILPVGYDKAKYVVWKVLALTLARLHEDHYRLPIQGEGFLAGRLWCICIAKPGVLGQEESGRGGLYEEDMCITFRPETKLSY
jgi:hypothetical protein